MLRKMVVEKVELTNMEGRLRETEMQADEQKLDLVLLTKTSLEELRRDHTAMEERLRASEKRMEELKKVNMEQSGELSELRVRLGVSDKQVGELRVENQAAGLLSIEARAATLNTQDG